MTYLTANYDSYLLAAADKAQGRDYDKDGVVASLTEKCQAFVKKLSGLDEDEIPAFSAECKALIEEVQDAAGWLDRDNEEAEYEALAGLIEDLQEWV